MTIRSSQRFGVKSDSLLSILIRSSCLLLSIQLCSLLRYPAHSWAQDNNDTEAIDPGPFSAGRFLLSAGGSGGGDGISLQLRVGYLILNGLATELDARGVIPFQREVQQWVALSPGMTYYLYHTKPLVPYVGAFYQEIFIKGIDGSLSAWGGRSGVIFLSSHVQLGLGARFTRLFNCHTSSLECTQIDPEITLSVGF